MGRFINIKTARWVVMQYFKNQAYNRVSKVPNHKFEEEICDFGKTNYEKVHLVSTYSRQLRNLVHTTPRSFEALGFTVKGDKEGSGRREKEWIITSNMP